MPHLLVLANEIIFQIWEYIATPEDIRSFALVCKTIYVLAEPALREHHRLRTYSRVVLQRKQLESPPADLLETLTHNSRISLYIGELLINGWAAEFDKSETWGFPNTPQIFHIKYPKERMDLFLQTVDKSGLAHQSIRGKTWRKEIQRGNEDPILALVFLMLPRLKTLTFQNFQKDFHFLATAVAGIIESPKINSLAMLTNLILVEPYPTEVHDHASQLFIEIFAGLPSLRTLEGYGIIDNLSFDPNFPDARPIKASNLTDIAFWNCHLYDEWLTELLQSMNVLKSFRYTHGYHRTQMDLRVFQVTDVLAMYAGETLEILTLHSCRGEWKPVAPLYRCQVLKELNTDYHLLLGYWEDPNDQKLQGSLPSSIETVKLYCWDMTNLEEIGEVVLGIVGDIKEMFPKFRSLELVFDCSEDGGGAGDQDGCKVGVYRGNMEAIREMKKVCAEVGLELKISGHLLHRRPFTSKRALSVSIRFSDETQDDCWPPYFRHTHSLPGEYSMAPF